MQNEMSRACSAHAVTEKCSTACWWGYVKERDYMGDVGLVAVFNM